MLESLLLLYFYLFAGGWTKVTVLVISVEVRGSLDVGPSDEGPVFSFGRRCHTPC